MQVVESKFEIDQISETVGLSFKRFDFIIDSFDFMTALFAFEPVVGEHQKSLLSADGD